MWFSISEHSLVTLYSLIMGIIFGVFYDFIKLSRICMGLSSYSGKVAKLYQVNLPVLGCIHPGKVLKKKGHFYSSVLFFIGDVFYALICAVLYSLFLFHAIRGQVRWYFVVASAIGFLIYYFTISRIILVFLEFFVFCVRIFIKFALTIVLFPFKTILMFIRKIVHILFEKFILPSAEYINYKKLIRYTAKKKSRLHTDIKF